MLLASGRGPLFAIVGETITSGRLPIRLERFGRPEVKNFLLGPRSHDRTGDSARTIRRTRGGAPAGRFGLCGRSAKAASGRARDPLRPHSYIDPPSTTLAR